MFGGRKHRLTQLEIKTTIPSERMEAIKHYMKRIDLSKNILLQMQEAEPYAVNYVIQEAGNYRDETYQRLIGRKPDTLKDEELVFVIKGSTKKLLQDELEFLQEWNKRYDGMSDKELIDEIVGN